MSKPFIVVGRGTVDEVRRRGAVDVVFLPVSKSFAIVRAMHPIDMIAADVLPSDVTDGVLKIIENRRNTNLGPRQLKEMRSSVHAIICQAVVGLPAAAQDAVRELSYSLREDDVDGWLDALRDIAQGQPFDSLELVYAAKQKDAVGGLTFIDEGISAWDDRMAILQFVMNADRTDTKSKSTNGAVESGNDLEDF